MMGSKQFACFAAALFLVLSIFGGNTVSAYAGNIQAGAITTEQQTSEDLRTSAVEHRSEKLGDVLKRAKTLEKKTSRLSKQLFKQLSQGKLTAAEKNLEKVQKSVKKAKAIRAKAKELKRGYSELKPLYGKVAKQVGYIVGSFREAKNEVAKFKKSIKNRSAAARRLHYNGVVYSGGWRYTWYSQNVLPGYGLSIPGRHVGTAGLVMDGYGRVCVASSDLAWGTVISTPYGPARVYDCGCPSGTIDVYTSW